MNKALFILVFIVSIGASSQASGQIENPVGQRTFSFEDKNRNRKLVTEVWYPTTHKPSADEASPFVRIPTARNGAISEGKFPVILFSHGTGGGRLTVEWMCAGLAANGFIVVAVDHFGNTFDNPIPIEFVKFWERPQDLTFVFNELLASSEISPFMDVNRVGAAGFSLGGYTAITLAGSKMDYLALQDYFTTEKGRKEAEVPEMPGLSSFLGKPELKESFTKAPPLHDKRIKSIFVMSPALGQAFPGRTNFKDVFASAYIVVAGNDQIAPLETNAAHYAAMMSGAQYKVINSQAGHYIFLNEANESLKRQAPLFFEDTAGVNRKSVHEETLKLAVAHFKKELK